MTLNEREIAAEVLIEVRDEITRTFEQMDDPTREDVYADVARRMERIATNGASEGFPD
jgi:hypothetical protein